MDRKEPEEEMTAPPPKHLKSKDHKANQNKKDLNAIGNRFVANRQIRRLQKKGIHISESETFYSTANENTKYEIKRSSLK
jgi:hypothetical protein